MRLPERRPCATITVARDGQIRTVPRPDPADIALFTLADFPAACVAARVIVANARRARHGLKVYAPDVSGAWTAREWRAAAVRWQRRVAAILTRHLSPSEFQRVRAGR